MNKFILSLNLLVACCVSSIAAPLPEKAELLASNTVSAQYLGTRFIPCHFRTALCPDRCNHSKTVAVFEVLANEAYSKPGKYGDAKADVGSQIMIEMNADVPGQESEVNGKIADLKPGDKVRMTQMHYYAEVGNCHMPIRPVTEFKVTFRTQTPLPPLQTPADVAF